MKPTEPTEPSEPAADPQASAADLGHQPLAEVGRRAVQRHLKKLRKRLPRILEGEADEAVHDARVATRNLRAVLETLEAAPVFDAHLVHTLYSRLKRLASALGEVRDLDVFLQRVADFERQHPLPAGGLGPLRDTLTQRHATAFARLRHELDRKRTRHLLADLRHFAGQPSPAERHDDAPQPTDPPAVLVRHLAGGEIWRRYEAVLAFEALMPDATPETLHALRIACKRLRYVLELFAAPKQHPTLTTLHTAQDHLGALHDDVVALTTVDELRATHADDDALTFYAEALAQDRDALCANVAPIWESLSGQPMRQQLANFIAAL